MVTRRKEENTYAHTQPSGVFSPSILSSRSSSSQEKYAVKNKLSYFNFIWYAFILFLFLSFFLPPATSLLLPSPSSSFFILLFTLVFLKSQVAISPCHAFMPFPLSLLQTKYSSQGDWRAAAQSSVGHKLHPKDLSNDFRYSPCFPLFSLLPFHNLVLVRFGVTCFFAIVFFWKLCGKALPSSSSF